MSTTEPPGAAPPAPPTADEIAQVGQPLVDLLAGFIVELRRAGLPVSLTENLDAMEAVRHIPLDDRDAFQVRVGRHVGQEPRTLAGVRDRLRGLLLDARREVVHRP
ncbi:MAG: hypothetical protein V9E94_01370 [Microthrixaceae bacterium]